MDKIINWLVSITLIEMMIAIGLSVSFHELSLVAKNRRLILTAFAVNYVCVPVAALALILVLKSPPLIAAGFLIVAVCPGASYGPPITSLGKGNLPLAVGLMVVLAGSSAIFAPLLLHSLLFLSSNQQSATIDLGKVFLLLMVTQFAPLALGLTIRHWLPAVAKSLGGPAKWVGIILNTFVIGWLFATHYSLFGKLNANGVAGMSVLLLTSLVTGWLFGGPAKEDRRTLALCTSLRNVGLSLVITTGAFPGTPAVTAVLGYGLFEIVGSLFLAAWWNRV